MGWFFKDNKDKIKEEIQLELVQVENDILALKKMTLSTSTRFKINDYKFIIRNGQLIVDGPDEVISRQAGRIYLDMLESNDEEMIKEFITFLSCYNKIVEYLELPEVENHI